MARLSTKIHIPHTAEPDLSIVGVLEQHAPEQPTEGRRIALLLHGTLGFDVDGASIADVLSAFVLYWCGSDYISVRGNHETGGTWKQGAIHEDIEDIKLVVEHLKTKYGYVIDLVVGHSRGSIAGFHWMCTSPEGLSVGAFVNASGRYRMRLIFDSPAGQLWKANFASKGCHEWQVTVARKAISARIVPADVEDFVKWDTSIVWDKFPKVTDVFTLHGLSDAVVPPYDGVIYARALSNREPGTHTLHLMEGADHNFTGRQDEVVDVIMDWLDARSRGGLKSGVWLQGFKGKL
ncbi:hypothetical protein ONZ45_g286 [Pleurotus djamor]|nr:hypothetical protein ONZ45_g286 [Pleurotus djamor]